MSAFSNLDASNNAANLLSYLDTTDKSLSSMKAYIAALAQLNAVGQPVLDLGCGVGHDLSRLAAVGVVPIGLDSSEKALDRAKSTGHRVVRGDGARLPFATNAFAGCRIERVLEHVADPEEVLDEIIRVVRPRGFIAIFEPDFDTFLVASDVVPDGSLPGRFVSVRHPRIGTEVAALLETRGCRIDDITTERSFGYDLNDLPLSAAALTQRGVDVGLLDPTLRKAWLEEQQQRTTKGEFEAEWSKILTVARCPATLAS